MALLTERVVPGREALWEGGKRGYRVLDGLDILLALYCRTLILVG